MEERKSRYELFLEEEERKAQPTKQCSKCGKIKDRMNEFYKNNAAKDGFQSQCKSCRSAATRKYEDRQDRFWKFFNAHIRRVGNCIEWTGGYMHKTPICGWLGKSTNVRYVVFSLSIGEISDNMVIVPKCKNTKCVRHSHLIRVTKDDLIVLLRNNAAVGDRNGAHTHPERWKRGESINWSKLTEDDVRYIRSLPELRWGDVSALARRFGVTRRAIQKVIIGQSWAHVK